MVIDLKEYLNEIEKKTNQCPMVLVQRLVGGKWKLLLLWNLSISVLRFSELKRKFPAITPKMLTNQLRSLEEDNLIFRKVYPVVPPKVEYGLTETGKKIIPLLYEMSNFGLQYLESESETNK